MHITKASCQAWLKLLIANEVRIGGLGGSPAERGQFEAVPQPFGVATVVGFAANVPGGNWVTVGFDSPGPCMDVHWGGQNRRKAMEELAEYLEKIGVRLSTGVCRVKVGGEECEECSVRSGQSLTCIGGEGQNIRKAMEELEKIGMGPSKAV